MITFVGLKNRSAGKIRGEQLANEMGGYFYDFSEIYTSNLPITKIVIIVRNRQDKDFEKALKDSGCIVGYDILDNPIGDFLFRDISPDFSRYVDDKSFDFYITNNTENASELSKYTQKKIFVIPHHSVNFNKERSCNGQKIKKVGYLGLDYGNKKQKDIKDICDDLEIEYLCYSSNLKDECADFLKTLDAGIIFVDEESPGNIIRKYKPNTKLINFQSFGIPVICSEYSSFLEFGDENYISVKTLNDVRESLKILISDKKKRADLSDRSFITGSRFHISQIIKDYYLEIFEYFKSLGATDE